MMEVEEILGVQNKPDKPQVSSPAIRRAIHDDHGPPVASGSCRFTSRLSVGQSEMPCYNNTAGEREPVR